MSTLRSLRRIALPATLILLAANCGDRSLTGPAGAASVPGVIPANALAAHDPQFPRLYFLPPMVAETPFEGTFDATLEDVLTVEICRLAGSSCSGAPLVVLQSGDGPTDIRLDAAEQHYHVNWHVRGTGLTPGDYRLTVRAGSVAIGDIDLRLASKPQELKTLPEHVVGVQIGRTLPVKFRIARPTDQVMTVLVEPATAIVGLGGTQQFTATVIGADGTPRPGQAVTWTTSDAAVATVDGSGLATGVTVGSVTITATADGVSGSATLDVRAPDLSIGSLTVSTTATVGAPMSIEGEVANGGNADAAATDLRVRVLDAEGGEIATSTVAIAAITAGSTAPYSASFTPDATWPREISVEVTADAGATVTESDETNNTARAEAIPVLAPDLAVTVTVPAEVAAGSDLAVKATVSNGGNGDAAAAELRVRVLNPSDNSELAATTVPQGTVAVGASVEIDVTIATAHSWPSRVIVEVTTDAAGALAEWDESNNTTRSGEVVVTRPDLDVTALTVPTTIPAGTSLDVAATVTNAGNGAAAATDARIRVLDAANGTEVATTTVPQAAVAAGANVALTASFPSTTAWPRSVTVEVTTDFAAAVTESDEANNVEASAAITLTLSDLTVSNVGVPANLPAGGVFNVEATIANAGTADAAATDARFRVLDPATDTELATHVAPQGAVTAGGTLQVSVAFTSSRDWPRNVVVEVMTDAGGNIAEIDEANNTARSAVIGLTDPDFVITSVTFSATTVGLRCALGIQAVVKNVGTGNAPATTLRFTLRSDAGAPIAQLDVAQPGLTAGAELTIGGTFTAGSDWPGLVTGLAEADATGAVPESDEANNAGATNAVVETRVAVPAGFNKMWICGNNTSWTDGNNWEPAGAPTAGQNVYVPAGVAQYPVLTAAQTVNDLTIEPGANVNIATHDLNATGNVVSGGMTGTTGTLDMTGAGRSVRGTVPALEIHGNTSLSGPTQAASVLVIANRTLTLAGQSMTVAGTFSVSANGSTFKHLLMTNSADRLDVGGNMLVQGENTLTHGTIVLRGDFTQSFRATALQAPAGGTVFAFEGTGTQAVNFADATNSWFGDVVVRNTAPGLVNFVSNVRVVGQLVVAAGGRITQGAGSTFYTTRLPLETTPGSYTVPSSVVDGAALLTTDVRLASPVAGVRIQANRTLDLKGFTLAIGGDFSVAANGTTFKHLLMTTGSDRLEVGGDMLLQGENLLTAGVIVLRGDFTQSFRATALQANGTTFIFDGASPQRVNFADAISSWFDDVEIRTPEVVGTEFLSNVRVTGQLTVAAGARLNQTAGVTFYTTRMPAEAAPQGYRVSQSHLDQAVVGSRNVSLEWPGADVTITANHTFDLNGFSVFVGGDFNVAANGSTFKHLIMDGAGDRLTVGGRMLVQGENLLTAGTIVLRGGFEQSFRATALQVLGGGTRFEFEGSATQGVTFADATNSFFGDVHVRTSAPGGAVVFGTNVRVSGQLTVAAGGRLSQAAPNATFYTTRMPDPGTGTYEVNRSIADGAVVLDRNITLPWSGAGVEISANRNLNLAGFTFEVGGPFHVHANGSTFKHLHMLTPTDRLVVGGLMHLQGENRLNGGTIVLRGGFAQSFRATALQADGTTFVFDGSAPLQTVSFADAINSWFDDVEIHTQAPNRVDFITNVRVTGQLSVAAGARVTQSDGGTFYTTRMPDPDPSGQYEVPTSHADGTVILDRDIALPWPSASVVVTPNHTLDLRGFGLTVGGNFSVAANGSAFKHLLMTTGTDRLEVRGNMLVQGENTLTAGTIVLRGNLTQSFRATALQITGGGTRFVFDGAVAQTVSFADAINSFLGDVMVQTPQPSSTNFLTNVRVTGQLNLADGARLTQSAGSTFYTTRLPDPGTGQYDVPSSVADGAVVLHKDLAWLSPGANLSVSANHTLNLATHSLRLAGAFSVAANGSTFKHLIMTSPDATLDVGGLMHVQGENTLSAGTIVLRGGFSQSFRATAFQPSGTLVAFDGPGQAVNFADAVNSFFRNTNIRAGASVNFNTNGRVLGNLDLDGSIFVPSGRTVNVLGTLFFAGAITNNGLMTAGTCVDEGGTFAGTGNNPCP